MLSSSFIIPRSALTTMARLKERYQKEIAPAIAKEFGIKNKMAIPRLNKIVLNMGMGEAIENAKVRETDEEEMKSMAGQKPVITRAKKSIASFKLREKMPIGIFSRSLKLAIDFFARVITGFCPAIDFISSSSVSRTLAFSMASPMPILSTILLSRGIAILFLMPNSFAIAGAISF